MKIEDRSVTNSGIIHGAITTGDSARPAAMKPPAETVKTRVLSTPQVIAALIAGAAAIVAAIIGFMKN
jgi:hypothetical protein